MGGRAITVDDPIDELEGLFYEVITFDRAESLRDSVQAVGIVNRSIIMAKRHRRGG